MKSPIQPFAFILLSKLLIQRLPIILTIFKNDNPLKNIAVILNITGEGRSLNPLFIFSLTKRKTPLYQSHATNSLDPYRSLDLATPLFPLAADWLQQTDLDRLQPGRYDIAGADPSELWVQCDEGELAAAHERSFEAHRRMIDLQVPVAGPEFMEIAPVATLVEEAPYDATRDLIFFQEPTQSVTRCLLNIGDVMVSIRKMATNLALPFLMQPRILRSWCSRSP